MTLKSPLSPPSTTISISICVWLCIRPEGGFVVDDGCLGMVRSDSLYISFECEVSQLAL